MPSAGIHGFTGLILAGCVDDSSLKLGMVVGSMLPDADLIVSSLAYLATGKVDAGKKIHRTWSHSWVVHFIICMIGLILAHYTIAHSSGQFLIGLACLMAIHSLMDYLYIGYMTESDAQQNIEPGVALLLPLTQKKYALWPKVFSERGYNLITAIDFLPDPIFIGSLVALSLYYQTNHELQIFFFIVSVIFLVIFITFFMYAYQPLKSDFFTVAIHYPGIVCLIIVLCIPCFFVATIERFCW